jgi:hypothetical protein
MTGGSGHTIPLRYSCAKLQTDVIQTDVQAKAINEIPIDWTNKRMVVSPTFAARATL